MSNTNTLLKTKFYIPPAPPQLVARPHLLRQLDGSIHRKLTLVSAPPGFGKTTLLSAWVHQQTSANGRDSALAGGRVAWLSLDEADNDPIRFWTYLITALEAASPDLGADAMALLQEPQSPPIEEILTALINTATEIEQTLVLILDDYHVIESAAIHQALTFLLDHLPPHMHLMMTSRSDPPLPLVRLRVRSQLTELRDSDLRFNPAEAAVFLNQVMGLELSAEAIQALEGRTEGWIAGLQLAALSMQGRDDTESFVQAFTGSHRYIIDYLAEEVLAQQPPHIRRFLLHTSILDRLCGPLCDALLQLDGDQPAADSQTVPQPSSNSGGSNSQDSQEILEYLEQANLFLIPLDDERRWYRYHHLFADVLRENLQQLVGEERLNALHSRASRWYSDSDLVPEAVDHALAAGDDRQAIRLIEQVVVPLLTSGEVTTVQSWLDALPEAVILARPRLSLSKGWTLVIVNQWDAVTPYLEAAEKQLAGLEPADPERSQGWDETAINSMRAEAAAMRAMGEGNGGDAAKSIELCEQALALLSSDNSLVRSIVMLTLGNSYEAMGQLEKATQVLQETVAISQASSSLIIGLTALSSLGRLQEEQGKLHRAAEFYRQGMALVERKSQERGQIFPATRWTYIELAELHREWNELEEAKRLLTISLEMKRQINMLGGNLSIAYVILARILQAEEDLSGALAAIEQARQALVVDSPVIPWIKAVQARLWLAQGNLTAASRWAETCQLPRQFEFNQAHYPHYLQMPGEYTTLARIYMAQQQFEQATALLDDMQAALEPTHRAGRMLEVLLLKALLAYHQKQNDQAVSLLKQALPIGQLGGYVRLFADEGQPMAGLLRLAKTEGQVPDPAYLDTLLAATGTVPADESQPVQTEPESALQISKARAQSELIDPLSARELEVLQLVAEGLSNREIGERLFITVGTAKTHTINIYRKLDVNSRTQAVAKAQQLGILS